MSNLQRAVERDAAEIMEIKKKAFKEEFDLYGGISIPPKFDDINNFINVINKTDYYKIILDDGKIIGGLCVIKKSDEHCELTAIYIDPEYQNKGIGFKAAKMIEEIYPNAKKWTLETPHKSLRNHYFYEKLGYIKVGEFEPEFAVGKGFILIKFEKEIA